MTTDITKIIERVSKLLNLAGNNPNENEAAAAIAKAHEILAEHNLTMSQVEAAGPKEAEIVRERLDTETNFTDNYFRSLWGAVAKANYCYCFFSKNGNRVTFTLIGRPVNIIVASQMAMYLCQTVKRLCSKSKGNEYMLSFRKGAVSRLCERIREMNLASSTGTSLVVYGENEIKESRKMIEGTVTIRPARKMASRLVNAQAYIDGQIAGNKVSLNQQMEGGPQAPALG